MSGHSTEESGSVVLDTRRRRTREEREAILAELRAPGVKVSAVARRHGLSPSLLFRWRREAARQAERLVARTEGFLPVVLAASGEPINAQDRLWHHRDRAERGRAHSRGRLVRCRGSRARHRHFGTAMIPVPAGAQVWIAAGHTDQLFLICSKTEPRAAACQETSRARCPWRERAQVQRTPSCGKASKRRALIATLSATWSRWE
jgi:transposase-like protein